MSFKKNKTINSKQNPNIVLSQDGHNLFNEEEIDFIKKNYKDKGCDYCSVILGITPSSIRYRIKKMKIKTVYYKWSEDNLKRIILDSINYSDACRKMGLSGCGNRQRLKKYINIYKIDISHFIYGNPVNFKKRKHFTLEEILIENSTYTNSDKLKGRLYRKGFKKRECEICGQGEMWNNKKMSLILDHNNGIHSDNRLSNLRILCPNCNSTTDTFCRGNKKNKKKLIKENTEKNYCFCGNIKCKVATMCRGCYNNKPKKKYKRPDYETLLNQKKKTN